MNSFWKVQYIPKCSSTSSRLKDWLLSGECRQGTVLVAEEQSAGRGRLSRQWFSPLGNLALSLSLEPKARFEGKIYQYNLLASLALQKLIQEDYRQAARIKWPNDIHLEGKKLAGILSESFMGPGGPLIIIGIGLNLNSTATDFPEDLRDRLITLSDVTGQDHDLEDFVRCFLACFDGLLKLYHDAGFAVIKNRLEEKLLWRGETITVQEANQKKIRGICEGLDEDGFLILRDDKNRVRRILAGDVYCIGPSDQN